MSVPVQELFLFDERSFLVKTCFLWEGLSYSIEAGDGDLDCC